MTVKTRLTASLILFGLILFLPAVCRAGLPENGLAAYYAFDGSANDSSGNSRNLAASSQNPEIASNRYGAAAHAFRFNNSLSDYGEYFFRQADLTTDFPEGEGSLSAWVSVTQYYTGVCFTVFARSYSNWSSLTSGPFGARWVFSVCPASVSIDVYEGTGLTGAFGFAPEQWNFVTFTWSASGRKIYVNGAVVAQDSMGALNDGGNAYDWFIGKHPYSVQGRTPASSGMIDEVRIYSRALSPAEVQALYHDVATPRNLRDTMNGNMLTLNWDAASGAAGYRLGVGYSPGSYAAVAEIGNSTILGPFDISSVPAGTYYLAVKAYNGTSESGYSNEINITVQTQGRLEPPANLRYVLNGNLLTINWDASAGAAGYKLGLGAGSGSNMPFYDMGNITQIGPFDASTIPGTYYLKVKAYNGGGESVSSNEMVVKLHEWKTSSASTYNVRGSSAIGDPSTGLTFRPSQDASGTLSISKIIVDAATPREGEGFRLEYTGQGTVDVVIDREPGDWVSVSRWDVIRREGLYTYGWTPVPPSSVAGTQIFYTLVNSRSASMVHDEDGLRAEAATPSLWYWWNKALAGTEPALRRNNMSLQLGDIIDAYVGLLSENRMPVALARISDMNLFKSVEAAGCTPQENNAFVSAANSRSGRNMIELCQPSESTFVHETGHFMHDVLAGDAVFNGILENGLIQNNLHGKGMLWNRNTIQEEPAYLGEHIFNKVAGAPIHDVGYPGGVFSNENPEYARLRREDTDSPGLEGFGAALLSYLHEGAGAASRMVYTPQKLNWGEKRIQQPVPVIGYAWPIIFEIISERATSVNELRAQVQSHVGDPAVMSVLTERLGWSYNGKGVAVDSAGTPVADVYVTPICTARGITYETQESLSKTRADGIFELRRVFPGNCRFRLRIDGTSTVAEADVPYIDWADPTHVARNFGTFTIGQPGSVSEVCIDAVFNLQTVASHVDITKQDTRCIKKSDLGAHFSVSNITSKSVSVIADITYTDGVKFSIAVSQLPMADASRNLYRATGVDAQRAVGSITYETKDTSGGYTETVKLKSVDWSSATVWVTNE